MLNSDQAEPLYIQLQKAVKTAIHNGTFTQEVVYLPKLS